MITESQRRVDALASALSSMAQHTSSASHRCDQIIQRSRQLNSLTSPASDASAMLTQASQNLVSTMAMMKDALEKFDTVKDCEPAIKRLHEGAKEILELRKKRTESRVSSVKHIAKSGQGSDFMPTGEGEEEGGGRRGVVRSSNLSEQDVYAAADAMEIVRDAYDYFTKRREWKSSPSAIGGLEKVYHRGVEAMCLLVKSHLTGAGPAVKLKRSRDHLKQENASKTRKRLSDALQNRDLMKSVGEYEEFLPLDTRTVRELRAIFECLGGEATGHGPPVSDKDNSSIKTLNVSTNKVVRTEKFGSGCYTNLTKSALKTGFPHLNTYGEARKSIAYTSIDGYYRHLKSENRKIAMKRGTHDNAGLGESGDMDSAAKDAVRCLEHAMVVVAGEKAVYRCVVSPTSSHTHDDSKIPHEYKQALTASYSHIVAVVVDRALDIIETTFLKNANANNNTSQSNLSTTDSTAPQLTVRTTASASAAGLRILDGVRMLGPSLAKLCELDQKPAGNKPESSNMTIAGSLCISIHRSTVKNTAKMLENLAKAIESDPTDGAKNRPTDARVAAASSDVVRAIKLVSPFVSAYKSVTKRRALPWDQAIGEDAGDMDTFVRYLISKLMVNLQKKALKYADDVGQAEMNQAKSHIFIINNTFYLLEQLLPKDMHAEHDKEQYRLDKPWFKEKVTKIFESDKTKYLSQWEIINKNLTSVDKNDLTYQKDQLLSLESGRLLKSRFSGFIEDFERTYSVHKQLTVIDPKLRDMLQNDVRNAFATRYKKFFEKYSRLQFSKKNMDQYLKYSPQKVDAMIGELYATQ